MDEKKIPWDEDDEANSKDIISSLRRMRGTHKRKITIYLKKLAELKNSDQLTSSLCKNQIKVIEIEMSEVKKNMMNVSIVSWRRKQ